MFHFQYPTGKAEKIVMFQATEKVETENLRLFIFDFRSIKKGLNYKLCKSSD